MYYPDLSQYEYQSVEPFRNTILETFPNALNVGWLDIRYPFPTSAAPLSEQALDCLFAHCLHPVHGMKGHHVCNLCNSPCEGEIVVERDGRRARLGNYEILVVGTQGQAFLAPTMIYHYVTVHSYRPPEAFLEALLVSDCEAGVRLERQDWVRLGPLLAQTFDEAQAHRMEWQNNVEQG